MVLIDNLLTVTGVAKAHSGLPVLTDVDLTVRRGEIIGVVGANGVGKSTLMSILAGDYPAEAGEIVLNGRPYAPHSREDGRAAGVGLVRQHLVIEPGQTVAHALFRHTALAGRDDEELTRRAGRLLRSSGLDIDPGALMGDLLHTQQAIVEAVRMLAEDAQLVIMDEVGASFNADEIADLHFVVRRLTQQGRSIVYISHRLHEVVDLVDRIAVLRDGVITVELKPRRVTLEDLAAEMLSYDPGDPPDRTGHVGEDVAVEVAGLSTSTLHNVAFTLQRGEVLGLVGPRTGGMRDVVYALAGEIPARFETLRINETDRTIASPEDAAGLRILYLGEDARSLGIDPEARVADVLGDVDGEQLGITTSPDAPAGSLSGGQLRRIALQRWVDSDADLVLLVQPTRGLDVNSRPLVFEQLAAHTSAGHSAIVVSTEADELRGWCDRIAIMREGRIVDIVATERLDDALLHRLMSERQGEVVIPEAPIAADESFDGWDDEPVGAPAPADAHQEPAEAQDESAEPHDESAAAAAEPEVAATSPVEAAYPVLPPPAAPRSASSAATPVSPRRWPESAAWASGSAASAPSPVPSPTSGPTPTSSVTPVPVPVRPPTAAPSPASAPSPTLAPSPTSAPSPQTSPVQNPWQPRSPAVRPSPAPWTPPPTAGPPPASPADQDQQHHEPEPGPSAWGPRQQQQHQPAPTPWGQPVPSVPATSAPSVPPSGVAPSAPSPDAAPSTPSAQSDLPAHSPASAGDSDGVPEAPQPRRTFWARTSERWGFRGRGH